MTEPNCPRVDFYLLPGQSHDNIYRFCCRLAAKAWKLGNTAVVRVEDEHEARLIDDMMWTYNDHSFLPHARLGDELDKLSPIVIGQKKVVDDNQDNEWNLLINLATDVAEQSSNFQRIAEILNDNKNIKQYGRVRYSHYDKNNYSLQHHRIKA